MSTAKKEPEPVTRSSDATFSTRLDAELLERWASLCDAACINRSALVRRWIVEHVAELQGGDLQNGTNPNGQA